MSGTKWVGSRTRPEFRSGTSSSEFGPVPVKLTGTAIFKFFFHAGL